MLVRVKDFRVQYADLFPPDSLGGRTFAALAAAVDQARASATSQAQGRGAARDTRPTEDAMDDLRRIHYVAEHYQQLQGCVCCPSPCRFGCPSPSPRPGRAWGWVVDSASLGLLFPSHSGAGASSDSKAPPPQRNRTRPPDRYTRRE